MPAKFVAGIDYLVPLLDIGYIFFWIPGVILGIAGYPALFSWWSMLVIPITLIIYGLLRRWQERHVFRRLDVHPKQDIPRRLWLPVRLPGRELIGYLQYLSGAARRWK